MIEEGQIQLQVNVPEKNDKVSDKYGKNERGGFLEKQKT
jgi:hypothetical protein